MDICFTLCTYIVGVLISFTSIFAFIGFFILSGVILIALIADVGFSSSIPKEKRNSYSIHVLSAIIFSLVFAISFFYLQQFVKQKEAEKIISDLTDYKNRNGKYPDSLSNIVYKTILLEPSYKAYYDGMEYSFRYNFDGWSSKIYRSEDKEWKIED